MGNNIALTIEGDVVYKAKFDSSPFASGVSRVAFKGRLVAPRCKAGQQVVVKKFKREYSMHKDDWNMDLKISERAQELAQQFNEISNTNRPITFRQPLQMVVTETPTFGFSVFRDGEWVIAENFIQGKYTKWNTNNGWVNYKEMGGGGSLPAFSHWTWVKTGGELIVCDLQGVRRDNPMEYSLTDPAINSRSRQYGNTDIGMFGIASFFQTHRCTEFCQELGLVGNVPPVETNPLLIFLSMLFSSRSSTSYNRQVQNACAVRIIVRELVTVEEDDAEEEEDGRVDEEGRVTSEASDEEEEILINQHQLREEDSEDEEEDGCAHKEGSVTSEAIDEDEETLSNQYQLREEDSEYEEDTTSSDKTGSWTEI